MDNDKNTMPMAEFRDKFGDTFDKIAATIPQMPTLESLRHENDQLREALGTAAISLDCMTGLDSKNEYHRSVARGAIRVVMGA